MAYKDQTLCYRTINGERYVNWCDILEPYHDALVEKVKRLKLPHRVVKHPDGYGQLFVAERVPMITAD